jgi:hypothetical protein
MRPLLLIVAVLLSTSVALAEPAGHRKSRHAAPAGEWLPVKGATSTNSCAAYGAGFMKLEGSDTCVKIGGAIGIGAGVSSGSR